MRTLEHVFKAFGGPAQVGQVLGISTEHAAAMKRRGSIPARYWITIVRAAHSRGKDEVTLEALARIHAGEARAS